MLVAHGSARRERASRIASAGILVHALTLGLALALCGSALAGTPPSPRAPATSAAPALLPQPASVILQGGFERILADPARNRMYFTDYSANSLVVWNTTSNSVLANVSVGNGPVAMDFSWSGDELYVTLSSADALAVVNLDNLTLVKTIPLGVGPADVAGGRPGRAYVTTTEYWGYPRIVDTDNGVVLGSITAAGYIYQGALARTTLDRSTLIVAETGLSPAGMYAFNVSTDTVPEISAPPFDGVGENLMDFVVSPTQPWVLIASGWPYYVQVQDYRTWTSVATLNTGPYPSSVGLAQRGVTAFADHESSDVMAFYASNGTSRGTFTFSTTVATVRPSEDGTQLFAITSGQVEELATGFKPSSREPAVASAVASAAYGTVPATFTFYGRAVFGLAPYTFSWDFGDGSTGAGWNATHTYRIPGVQNVTLTVTDANHVNATYRTSVYVLSPLAPSGLALGVNLAGTGFSYPANAVVPPDTQVAVGPHHIVEMVNVHVVIWTRALAQEEDTLINSLFRRPAGEFLSDPRVVYDAPSSRWYASILDVNTSSALLAVSSSSDPTGGWAITPLSASGCPDQPMLGVGPLSVVVSANVFSTCLGPPTYTGAEYWVVNKTDLLAGRPAQTAAFGPYPTKESLHPVTIPDGSGTMYLVSVGWAVAPTNAVQVIPVVGSPPNAVPGAETDLPIRTVNEPPNVAQRGSSYQVNTGDSRVLDAIERDGQLWITFGDACSPAGPSSNQSCARILQVDPAAPAVVQDFDIGDPLRGYYYPALRFDAAGNLVVAFSYSSPQDYPGLMVTAQLAGDPLDTYRAPRVVANGGGPEALYCPDAVSCRFGDYSGASPDPIDPEAIWVAGEIGGFAGWQTTIASVGRFQLVNLTLRYAANGTMPAPPTVTYLQRGALVTRFLYSSYSTFPVDNGTAWSVSASVTGATSGERWVATGATGGNATASAAFTIPYEHQFYVNVNSANTHGGTASPAGGWYVAGTTIHLSATPTAGWLFSGWTGSGTGSYSGSSPSEDLVVSGPIDEVAGFNPGLGLAVSPGGSVAYRYGNVSGIAAAGSSSVLSVPAGSIVHLVATASLGWQFGGWSGLGNGSVSGPDSSQDAVMSGPLVEVALFDPGLVLAASAGGAISYRFGNVSGIVAPGTSTTVYVPLGTEVRVTALALSGEVFTGWSGNASGTDSNASVVIRGPSYIAAAFGLPPPASPLGISLELPLGIVIGVLLAVVAVLLVRNRRRSPPGPGQNPPRSDSDPGSGGGPASPPQPPQ